MSTEDAVTQRTIVNDLKLNLLVEAGAGTGKTYALVSRVAALVKSGVRMENIVAITFTEAAAAELSDRIRGRLEQLQDEKYRDESEDPLAFDGEQRLTWTHKQVDYLRRAVAELDRASIQTIHSFAARILRERPLDVGLPPGWVQWDEMAASQDFAKRWDAWLVDAMRTDGHSDRNLSIALRYLLECGLRDKGWRKIARLFSENHGQPGDAWLTDGVDLVDEFHAGLDQIRTLMNECQAPEDLLLQRMEQVAESLGLFIRRAVAPSGKTEDLPRVKRPSIAVGNVGQAPNWSDVNNARTRFGEIVRNIENTVLSVLASRLVDKFVTSYSSERKADGVATFDDLLVWARDLLLNENAWQDLRQRYQYILLDEFQDTDPLQAEIAFYLAAKKAPAKTDAWHQSKLEPGRLFIVGDPKQSIYRFRGADIGVTTKVKDGGQLQELRLVENRRSQEPILHWVNEVFRDLMAPKPDALCGVQADYVSLQSHPGAQRSGLEPGVRIFGGGSKDKVEPIRRREAKDVANLILAYASPGADRLKVRDECTCDGKECGCARPADLRDVCILIRSRTGLSILERSLECKSIPYRVEGGSLLFNTQEVQDLLNCLRAIDNPSDEVSVVAALRSPAFACSDVDLALWRHGHGRWNYLRKTDADGLVADSLRILRDYHDRRHSIPTSLLINDFIRERRLDELDLAEHRPREAWRRRQFLVEQARALEAANSRGDGQSPFSLNRFIRWAELQMEERNRITEVPVPETDDDAVRIMTIHGAKGLEFPIVFLLDLGPNPNTSAGPVVFGAAEGAAETKLGNLETRGYSALADQEKLHLDAEYVRLAYVAATRARDHLLISLHHSTDDSAQQRNGMAARLVELQDRIQLPQSNAQTSSSVPHTFPGTPPIALETDTYSVEDWQRHRGESIALRSYPQAITATGIAGHGVAQSGQKTAVAIEDKESEPHPDRPWRFGRGGMDFGSAVHGVLQDAVNRLLLHGPSRQGELDKTLQWLDGVIERLAPRIAEDDGAGDRVEQVVALAQKAIRNEWVLAALRAERLWPEIPVAAEITTPRGEVAIEGIIDLLYLDDRDDQLVILDYKSDQVSSDREVREKMEHYQWQGAAYAYAVEKATRKTVKDVRFLFVHRDRAESIPNLRELMDRLPERTLRTH